MAADFGYYSGPYELEDIITTDSSAIAAGDALEAASGRVNTAESNDKIVGVSLEDQGASTTDNVVQVLLSYGANTKFLLPREAGTFAVTEIMTYWDLNSPDGVDYDTTTNDDVYARRRLNADYGVGNFADPAALTSS